MKHIKPGRGPSMISGFTGLFMIAFGIVWTIMAGKASPMFALFGVFWTGIAIVTTIYNFKNATGKKRYSSFDITDSTEEADPLNEYFGEDMKSESRSEDYAYDEHRYCPYCGAKVENDHRFCSHCGKELR